MRDDFKKLDSQYDFAGRGDHLGFRWSVFDVGFTSLRRDILVIDLDEFDFDVANLLFTF